MTAYNAPIEEINFVLNNVVGMDKITQLPGFEEVTPDLVEAILAEAGRFASEVIAPTNQQADEQGSRVEDRKVVSAPVLDGLYQQMVDGGWFSLGSDPEYGGQGMPSVLAFAVDEMTQAANLAFSLCPLLTKGVVAALSQYGSDEQKDLYLPKLISGEWTGTMNLTESQAGTDLAAVRSKAVPEGNHYRISGEKIFITWGDHQYTDNIIHLVLARTPDAPEGVKGISLFVVPKFMINEDGSLGDRNDVYPASVEHKLGIHASPTCVLSFGADEGAVGYLIGKENEGLKYMFAMMNAARLGVGLQGVAISERAYQQAVDYAKERVQGAVPGNPKATIIKHPDVRRMLMQMRALTEGARALAYSAMFHEDHATHLEDAEQAAFHHRRVELLTPLVKGWCTEIGMEVTSLGVQVHGGMGFIEETGAAQHMRDARILPIYEGTNGVQAMDLVGRKLLRDGGKSARELLDEITGVISDLNAANNAALTVIADALEASTAACETCNAYIADNTGNHWTVLGSAAYNHLMLFGSTVAGSCLAKAALAAVNLNAAGEGNKRFNDSKVITATFFAQQILSKHTAYQTAILSGYDATMALDEEDF